MYRGWPPRINMAEIREKLSAGLLPTEAVRELGISRGTVCKAKKDLKDPA